MMSSSRRTAVTAGAWFIVADIASIASLAFLAPINASDYLVSIASNGNQVSMGALLTFIGAVADASIAISLYPTLRKHNEGLALGVVGFRIIEAALYVVGAIAILSLLTLSQAFVNSGAPNSSPFQTLGATLLAGYRWDVFSLALLAFSTGALMYYYIFYQTRLVPRWLSGWGLVAATLCIAASVLVLFQVMGAFSMGQVVLNLPIGVQEIALAVWLIVKGFSPSASGVGHEPLGTARPRRWYIFKATRE